MRFVHGDHGVYLDSEKMQPRRPLTKHSQRLPVGLRIVQLADGWAIAGFDSEQQAEHAIRRLLADVAPAAK